MKMNLFNLQGIGSRKRQEDSFAFVNAFDVTKISEKGLFAVLADGMGGMKDGKVASETAIAILREEFLNFDYEKNLAEQLHKSVICASEAVLGTLEGDGGSTVVACLVYNNQLYFASVGDSFLYLKRDHALYRMNREHNLLHQKYLQTIRRGSIDPGPARNCKEKAALTQFLGMEDMNEVDYLHRPFPLKENDVLLLCSDGVGDVIPKEELLKCLEQAEPGEMCRQMEQQIKLANKPYQDNYTALVIQCEK